MNGFQGIGLAFFSILTLGILGSVHADQPLVAANEQACEREKIETGVSRAPLRCVDIPIALVSHQCEGDLADMSDSQCSLTRLAPAAQGSIEQEYVELRVLNSELVARLEMTQAILELQNHYTAQILSLEREKAKLTAETAELRIKNEVNEQLTAVLVERTELASKLNAAHDWISSRTAYEASLPLQIHPSALVASPQYDRAIAAIQEDLSNVRRQLPLLKRTPVPFAVSNSVGPERPYVPVGNKIESTESATRECPTDEVDSPCREANARTARARY